MSSLLPPTVQEPLHCEKLQPRKAGVHVHNGRGDDDAHSEVVAVVFLGLDIFISYV